MSTNIVFDRPTEGVVVARFARPDLRNALDDQGHSLGDIAASELYQELHAGAVTRLRDGGVLVLNFGLVEVFVSAFFRLLLRTLDEVRARNARLLLCGFSAHAGEAFNIMGGQLTFETFPTEEQALAAASG
jgi:anti-anti-sigma regulatory factor